MSEFHDVVSYAVNDFIAWNDRNELNLSPNYQRNPVWDNKAKSYLIDTILRGLVIPPIFIRQTLILEKGTTNKEVIDGQQRLRAILEFKDNKFKILPQHNENFANMCYDDLPNEAKSDFLSYKFPVEIIKTNDDAVIYDIFARLNSSGIKLNAQELRNAKYKGYFKTLAYTFAKECKSFFVEIKLFDDKQLAQMEDVKFISTLLMECITNIPSFDNKNIEKYYQMYDEKFEDYEKIIKRFINIKNTIQEMYFEENLQFSINNKTNFLDLFVVLNHIFYTKNQNIERKIFSKKLNDFENEYQAYKKNAVNSVFKNFYKYDNAIKAQTNSPKNRRIRFDELLSYLSFS